MSDGIQRSVVVLLLLGLLGAAFSVPATRFGDASEYVMTTMSLVFDRDLVYEEKDLTRAVALRPRGTNIPAGLQLVQTADGIYRFGGHTIYYPLLAAPLYVFLGHRSFYVLNAVLFWAVLVVLGQRQRGSSGLIVGVLALVPSASFCYLFWTTPENAIMCFFALSLFFCERDRSFISGAALGVAAAMKFPLVLFSAALVAVGPGGGRWRGRGRFAVGFLLLFLPQLVYNVAVLRCVHATFLTPEQATTFQYFRNRVPYCEGFRPTKDVRVMHRWTHSSYFSPCRPVSAVLDPSMGLIWFYPLTLYLLVTSRWGRRQAALGVAWLLCLAVFCSVQRLFTHQVGLRALNYLYPVLLFLPGRADLASRPRRILAGWALLWGSTFAVFPLANSRDQLEQKPIPAYRLWAAARERLDERFYFERHQIGPRLAAENLYPDGWTVGGTAATLMFRVDIPAIDIEVTIKAADMPWQNVRWQGSGASEELHLRGGTWAGFKVPVPPGQEYVRVVVEADGVCPPEPEPRSLGVRIMDATAGQTLLYQPQY